MSISGQSCRNSAVFRLGMTSRWTIKSRVLVFIVAALMLISAGNRTQAARKVYYEPTVKNMIARDCGRCHSGPTRYLMDYDNLKTYADSGMLATMVQGPMGRFAGNDTQTILDWVNAGAPEKPAARAAHFTGRAGTVCPTPGGPGQRIGTVQITYDNTIHDVLKKDCLRCHSGHFRNLTTYQNVKIYVANGLLKTLVQLGGPMHRFAGPDSRLIIAWVNNGAPR